MTATYRLAAINFDHFHMLDNLRMALAHPRVEIVGVWDERRERIEQAVQACSLTAAHVFSDYRRCLEETRPDIVLLCPATAEHAEWTERVAPFDVHIVMEKPFAASLAEADRMIRAMAATGKQLAINWPLAWYPTHRTTKRLIDDGAIGRVCEVHYYDGNRGPLWHGAGKQEMTQERVQQEKATSWFYRRDAGGGSLLDYLGYGTTLATWFFDSQLPTEITATVDQPAGLEVDEHSITVARYKTGLSKFETRWGTFTDPWVHQPQPKCGFVIVGNEGTISSYDFELHVRLQNRYYPAGHDIPVDRNMPPFEDPIQYLVDCLDHQRPLEGPLSISVSRIGQQIVDTARMSAASQRTLPLLG